MGLDRASSELLADIVRAQSKHYQVPVKRMTIEDLMRTPQFRKGVSDVRNRRPFDYAYIDAQGRGGRWQYERGRTFAIIYPSPIYLRAGYPHLAAINAYATLRRVRDIL